MVDRPGREYAYDPSVGWRVDRDGVAVCVHPYRVGLAPGRYASVGEPLPPLDAPAPLPTAAALELPDDVADLEGWLVGQLRVVSSNSLAAAISRAERAALQRFPDRDVVAAMRRVLAVELTR
ncbi:hypothetical protein ACFQX7_27945 [Luedemannella flava]